MQTVLSLLFKRFGASVHSHIKGLLLSICVIYNICNIEEHWENVTVNQQYK